jgi:hypothetical protein
MDDIKTLLVAKALLTLLGHCTNNYIDQLFHKSFSPSRCCGTLGLIRPLAVSVILLL